ncbi:hypothetical protein Agub_g12391 [Astrephomene gubernaculifera]|uniref:Uncharacterized protein n=1 Tax=Astrephomene gubernaculifera TaxID=47775 RepID=A0AAD3E070_9CHLO|nr:hypothetical protein Agub_g12391 [Astrephomene gubernaculifera]
MVNTESNQELRRDEGLVGVSLRFLSDFASKVPPDYSTAQIVAEFVIPQCADASADGVVPYNCLLPTKYVGRAQHYVIHAWNCCFLSDLVVPLLQHFVGDSSTDPALRAATLSNTFLWVDCFCCPQPPQQHACPAPTTSVPEAITTTAAASASSTSSGSSSASLANRLAVVDSALRQCSSVLLMLDGGAVTPAVTAAEGADSSRGSSSGEVSCGGEGEVADGGSVSNNGAAAADGGGSNGSKSSSSCSDSSNGGTTGCCGAVGGAALCRSWCLYEVARALQLKGGSAALHVPVFEFPLDAVYERLKHLDVAASRAHSPQDRRGLLAALAEQFAGAAAGAAAAAAERIPTTAAGGGGGGRHGSGEDATGAAATEPPPAEPKEKGEAVAAVAVVVSPLLAAGPLGAASRAISAGIQDSFIGEAQQLIRCGLRSGPCYLAALRRAAEGLRLGGAAEGLAEAMALAAVKEHRRLLGEASASTLAALCNLALLRRRQGRRGEAEQLMRQVLEGRRAVLGGGHPDTAAACALLASMLGEEEGQGEGLGQQQDRLEEAVELWREALHTRRRTLGERHPDAVLARRQLAGAQRALGRLGEAEEALLTRSSSDVTARPPDELYSQTSTSTRHNSLYTLCDPNNGQTSSTHQHLEVSHASFTSATLAPGHTDTAISSGASVFNSEEMVGPADEAREAARLVSSGHPRSPPHEGPSEAHPQRLQSQQPPPLQQHHHHHQQQSQTASSLHRTPRISKSQQQRAAISNGPSSPPDAATVAATPQPAAATAAGVSAATATAGAAQLLPGRPPLPPRPQAPEQQQRQQQQQQRQQREHEPQERRSDALDQQLKQQLKLKLPPMPAAASPQQQHLQRQNSLNKQQQQQQQQGLEEGAHMSPRKATEEDEAAATPRSQQSDPLGRSPRKLSLGNRRASGTPPAYPIAPPIAAAMAGLAAAAAALPPLQVPPPPAPASLPQSGLVLPMQHEPPAPQPLPAATATAEPAAAARQASPVPLPAARSEVPRPPSRNVAIVCARRLLLRASGGGSAPACGSKGGVMSDQGAGSRERSFPSISRSISCSGDAAMPCATLRNSFGSEPSEFGFRGQASSGLGSEPSAPAAVLSCSNHVSRESSAYTLTPRLHARPRPDTALSANSTASAVAHITPRAEDSTDPQPDLLGSALSQLRLMKARVNVMRSGAEARAVLQLKLQYIRRTVEQALVAAGGVPPSPRTVQGPVQGTLQTPPLPPSRSAAGPTQRRPVRRTVSGSSRPTGQAPQMQWYSTSGQASAEGVLNSGRLTGCEGGVTALMSELSDLRLLLLTTTNTLSAAHGDIHQELLPLQALGTELADLQRKLVTSVGPAAALSLQASYLSSGNPLCPSSPEHSPLSSGATTPDGRSRDPLGRQLRSAIGP